MKNRWLLNIVLIVFIGAGFYGITSAINMMAMSQELQDHEFSYIKRTADKNWKEKNHKEAARYYKELADSDDTNCIAHFMYPFNLTQVIERHLDPVDNGPKMTEEELGENVQNAIDGYLEAIHFTQFRNVSRVRLSALYGLAGEVEKSKEFAILAYRDGGSLREMSKIFTNYGCAEIHEELMREINLESETKSKASN